MAKYIMSLTYKPKIEAVFNGGCRQTIRKGTKYQKGDEILIHTWEGLPYRSKWGKRKRVVLTNVISPEFREDGIVAEYGPFMWSWESYEVDRLAAKDGIDPPTGYELKHVLKLLNGKDWEGTYQILRW